jgi:hypothetical protein
MQQMIIKGGDGSTVRGHYWTDGESVTVRSSCGRQKAACLHGSTPRGLARLLLLDMHPVPPTLAERREAERSIKRDSAEQRFRKMFDYATRGRRFEGLSDAKLLKVWTAAYDKMEEGPPNDVAQEALTFDLDAEYQIRGLEPPYQEWLERRQAKRSSAKAGAEWQTR